MTTPCGDVYVPGIVCDRPKGHGASHMAVLPCGTAWWGTAPMENGFTQWAFQGDMDALWKNYPTGAVHETDTVDESKSFRDPPDIREVP